MGNSCTQSCYTLPTVNTWVTAVHSHVTHCRQLQPHYMVPVVNTWPSYEWAAVICGLVMYGQQFHSADNNITLQQQGIPVMGLLRGILKGLGRVLDLSGARWWCVLDVCVVSCGVVCAGCVCVVSYGVVCAGCVRGELWCCVCWICVW